MIVIEGKETSCAVSKMDDWNKKCILKTILLLKTLLFPGLGTVTTTSNVSLHDIKTEEAVAHWLMMVEDKMITPLGH